MGNIRSIFLRRRRLLLVFADLAVILGANLLANLLRFDTPLPVGFRQWPEFTRWLQLDLFITPLIFLFLGLYRAAWRYASIRDMVRIFQAVVLRTFAVGFVYSVLNAAIPPRSVVIMDTVLLFLMVAGLRLATRMHRELRRGERTGGRPVLIVGAGESGEMIVREMLRRPDLDHHPIGFIDEDPEKHGVLIHGVPVIGAREDLEQIVEDRGVVEVIVAIPSASAKDLREIRSRCGKARLKAVPAVSEMIGGSLRLAQVREVRVEDLLGREAVVLDAEAIRRDIQEQCVLVTGGGGSIGRELARQLIALRPSRLVLFDRSENNLFSIGRELDAIAPEQTVQLCVGDIQDEARSREILARYRPRVVYHAAAYKHVPMMEFNLIEAISNNILGTWQMARLAAEHKVARFVLISTDKAVNPTSVMGKTKRVAELIAQSMNGGTTRFISVRFGNVLGSDGSVVPIFREQIRAGGPVTVTHPEATRYFMTIPEAVQLVMQAGSMGAGGEIFMLDMGQPVLIHSLARNLIELSGLRPSVDIDIVFTGLRPGERLHEQLSTGGEATCPTSHEKIVVLQTPAIQAARLQRDLAGFTAGVEAREIEALTRHLSEVVEAFAPPAPPPADPVRRRQGERFREAFT